jgi:hypothetical protein
LFYDLGARSGVIALLFELLFNVLVEIGFEWIFERFDFLDEGESGRTRLELWGTLLGRRGRSTSHLATWYGGSSMGFGLAAGRLAMMPFGSSE